MAATGTYYTYYRHSGSNTPRSADDGGDVRFYFKISETTDASKNTSTITTKCYAQSQTYRYLAFANMRVRINSTYKYVSAGVKVGSGSITTLIGTTIHTVNHNADGTGSCTFLGSGEIDDTYIYTSNPTFTLITIPRYADITSFTGSATGMESMQIKWGANVSCDAVQYKLNNGSWIGTSGTTFNITGLSPNTNYQVKIRVKRTDSQLWTESSTINVTTIANAVITSSFSEFDIGNDLNFTFSNPSNQVVNLRLETLEPTATRITRTGISSPYTLEFTEEEIALLYSLTPNSNSMKVRLVIDNVYNGHTYHNWKDGTAKVKNQNPLFTFFDYEDSNPLIVEVTGSNQSLVRDNSSLKIIISNENKMITQASATPDKYIISCDEKIAVVDYSDDDIEINLNEIASAGLKRITIRAIDSRENETIAYKDVMIYDYEQPKIIASAKRLNDFENQTTIQLNGSYSLVTIDSIDKNTITPTGIKYRYAEITQDYPDTWIEMTRTLDGNLYVCNNVILNLDNEKAYKIELEVKDLIDKFVVALIVDVGQELMYLNSETGDLEIKGNFKTDNNLYGKDIYCQSIYLNNEKLEKFQSKLLPRGTNLNDITEVGMYYNPANADAETMHNLPYANSFSLLVEKHAGIKQTFTRYHSTYPFTYIRNHYNGTWGPWRRVAFISYGTGNPGTLIDGEIYIKY